MKDKKISLALVAIVLCNIIACNNDQSKDKAPAGPAKPAMARPINDTTLFANIKFDSKWDLSCGMPVTAGVEDTAHYKGKVYGFCSKECKADFLKDPAAAIKSKN